MTIVDEGKIDEQAAAEHIHGICLKTGPPRRVGIEIEWLVRDARNPAIGVSAERITDAMSGFAAVARGFRPAPLRGCCRPGPR